MVFITRFYPMSISNNLTSEEKTLLQNTHAQYKHLNQSGACTTTVAVFLIVPAIIVIFSGALILTLPGVNAMRSVILPAFLPAAGAIVLSLPFIFHCCKNRDLGKIIRKNQVGQIGEILKRRNFSKFKEKENAVWIKDNLVMTDEHPLYNTQWLEAIKENLPENQKKNKEDPLVKAISLATKNLYKKKKNKPKKAKKTHAKPASTPTPATT